MKYLITCLLIFIAAVSFSQESKDIKPHARKSMIEYNGNKYDGYEIELNASPEVVEDALKQHFKSLGTKPKQSKGFMAFRNVSVSQISTTVPIDAFVKIDKKGKKEKDQTVVSLITAPAGEITEEKTKADAATVKTFDNGDALLLAMVPAIAIGAFDKDLAAQQLIVKKEEKNLENLRDDQSDLESKIKKLQSDLEFNMKAQEKQTLELDKVKAKLSELTSKKPGKVN